MKIQHLKSKDGTSIAYEVLGEGPPLILVGGAFSDRAARASGTPLAAHLAHRFKVFSYDRRGRGGSTDTAPYALERELEDLEALIAAAGAPVCVFGNSSGALLALDTAARGRSISRLALFEPPIVLDAERTQAFSRLAEQLAVDAASGRRGQAVELFLERVVQLPAPALAQLKRSPTWAGLEGLAHTLSFDVRFTARGAARLETASSVQARVLALAGGASPPWMRQALEQLVGAISGARLSVLEGQTHDVDPKVLADALEAFFSS